MTQVNVVDMVTLADAQMRTTGEGYLVADARVARIGIQVYRGTELGIVDRQTIRVWRPEEEVFRDSAMRSYAHRPVTVGHPSGGVNSKNWKDLSVGQTGDEVVRDGEFVRVPLVLMDQAAIDAVNSGVRELSMGYSCNIELADGVTPDGQEYDAIMRDLRMNHLAVVPLARGGSQLRLGDGGAEPMADPIKTKTVVVDGLSIEVTEQGAQVIEKLQKQLADATSASTKLAAEHSAELAKRDARIEELTKSQLTDAQIEERAKARALLMEVARKIHPEVVTDGKTDAEVRRSVVEAKIADRAVLAGKDQAYVDARFDVLAEQVRDSKSTDPVRTVVLGGVQQLHVAGVRPQDSAYAESIRDLSAAWMGADQKKEA